MSAEVSLEVLVNELNVEDGITQLLSDIAASNPDIVQFQLMLNQWLKRTFLCADVAFLVLCRETGQYSCQVFGEQLLSEPVPFADEEEVILMLTNKTELAASALDETHRYRILGLRPDSLSLNTQPKNEGESSSDQAKADAASGNSELVTLIPINAKRGLVAVLCIYHADTQGKSRDLEGIRAHIRVLSALLSVVLNIEEQRRLAEQSQVFLAVAKSVFSSLEDMSLLVRNITKEAKALVQAQTCSLFLLDKEHKELVAEVFEKNGINDEYLKEIRLPVTSGIAGHVATSGVMMNVTDAYSHPLFYNNVDASTGFHTKNILCIPIKDTHGEIVGVAELCNKIGRQSFTKYDEQVAQTFAVYCAISISHCLLYRKLQEANKRSTVASELMVYDSQLKVAEEDVMRICLRQVTAPAFFHQDFCKFSFTPRHIQGAETQIDACIAMFDDLGFVDKWRIRRRTLARFLLMVQRGYREVPYHNWNHAFATAHFGYLLLKIPAISVYLTDLERLSLLVACLCHDVDHRGTNNAFQLASKTPLAQLYSSEGSVLERHHFAQTACILNMDDCNIFENLPSRDYIQLLDHIRDTILATDLAQHLTKVGNLLQMINEGYNSNLKTHHYLLQCLLMTSSDLSDQTKQWQASKLIAANIYTEFFSQGDMEKAMGNKPLEMMDREKACIPKLQIDFLDMVGLPVFDILKKLLPETQCVYDTMFHGRRCWAMMEKFLQENIIKEPDQAKVDILRDKGLETMILQRVAEEKLGTPR